MASTILSYSLALALLCFSFHACNARSLIGVLHENAVKKSQQHSSSKGSTQKDDQMLDPARVSARPDAKSSTPNPTSDARGENKLDIINGESEEHRKNHQTPKAGEPVKESVTTENESPSRVSWKVPHNKKRGEQEPGFNLDYLPPKTHPPVHN